MPRRTATTYPVIRDRDHPRTRDHRDQPGDYRLLLGVRGLDTPGPRWRSCPATRPAEARWSSRPDGRRRSPRPGVSRPRVPNRRPSPPTLLVGVTGSRYAGPSLALVPGYSTSGGLIGSGYSTSGWTSCSQPSPRRSSGTHRQVGDGGPGGHRCHGGPQPRIPSSATATTHGPATHRDQPATTGCFSAYGVSIRRALAGARARLLDQRMGRRWSSRPDGRRRSPRPGVSRPLVPNRRPSPPTLLLGVRGLDTPGPRWRSCPATRPAEGAVPGYSTTGGARPGYSTTGGRSARLLDRGVSGARGPGGR